MTSAAPLSRTPLRWWDVGVTALTLLLCVPGGAGAIDWADAGSGAGGRLALNLGVLAVFALLYVVLGRAALLRGMRDADATHTPTRSRVFLVLLVVTLGVATLVEPSYATLQALAHPMAWVIVPRYRTAVAWSAALAAAIGAGSSVAYARAGIEYPVWTALVIAGLSFGFAVILGTWISRIFDQSERYRAIAAELRASQRDVARLSTEAGAAQERERLSRELHDTLTQTLAGLVMLSEQATRALDSGDTDRTRDRLERVELAAREAVIEARAIVATTQPLGDGGLEAAIERVALRMAADTGLDIVCTLAGSAMLSRELQVVLLRATQEGLANARKHARATRVEVTLTHSPNGDTRLLITDNGVGPAQAALAPAGFGLSGLAQRVREAGGEVSFGPGDRGGARLEVLLRRGEGAA
ncbi:sensor histidine kinase [Leucobacter sp. HY1910]